MKNAGINAAKDFATAGGTISGILMTISFFTIKLKISVEMSAIIIATKSPALPISPVGIPDVVSSPNFSCLKVMRKGVTRRNDTRASSAPEIPSSL